MSNVHDIPQGLDKLWKASIENLPAPAEQALLLGFNLRLDLAKALAAVGATGAPPATPAASPSASPDPASAPATPDPMPEVALPPLRAIGQAGGWVQAAVALAAVGVVAHTVAVVTRGLAVHRAPWGNMYEFVTAPTCVAAIFFLFVPWGE